MFASGTYIERRYHLKRKMTGGIALFLGNEECGMNYADNTYHFRQDSTFIYYFGFLKSAAMAAVIDFDSGEEVIFGDELTIDHVVWTGPLPTIKDQAAYVGITTVRPLSELPKYLSVVASRKVHYLPPYRAEHKLKLFGWLNIPFELQAEQASTDLIKAVVAQRNHKSSEEIVEIEKAVDVSLIMHIAAIKAAREGLKEYEVASVVSATAQGRGCTLSFPVICTVHGETLHNHNYSNRLTKNDLLLIDAGAELPNGYCGDLTTTVAVSGRLTSRQKDVYRIVMEAYYNAVAILKPGIPFRSAYNEASRTIVEGMKSLGLMKGDAEEAVAAGAHAMFFQCGLGHVMGLDVHDMENLGEVWVGYNGEPKSTQFGLKSLRLSRPINTGDLFTVEPGIYFIPTLIDMWSAEKRFSHFINYEELQKWRDCRGIRYEDDFVVEESQIRRLGTLNEYRDKTINDLIK